MPASRLPLLIALALLWGCAGTPAVSPSAGVPTTPPNIILITAEDLSPRVGFMGDDVAVTPNLDALAKEGIVFTRTFTTAGVCAPARAALITGVHQTTLGAMHMRTSSYGRNMDRGMPYEAVPPPDVKAFPELLRSLGYHTVNYPKKDYQFGDPFTVWDEDRAGDWSGRADGQPFFAMLNFNVTHESWTWMPGLSTDGEPGAANAIERNARLHEGFGFEPTDPAKVKVPAYYPDTPTVRANLAWHYDNIREMDRQAGELLDRLRAEGRFDDSIIIFTTDHGDGLPRHKRTIFDSGTHVPLIIRFPNGWNAGERRADLVSFVDMAPTIIALAGGNVPDWIQGRDLFADREPEAVFMAGDRFDEVPQRFRGIREERWHYIRYFSDEPVIPSLAYQNRNPIMHEMRKLHDQGLLTDLQASYLRGPAPREYLFDTEHDPNELDNLADDPRFSAVKARLANRLDGWIRESNDLGRLPESELVEQFWPGGVQPGTETVDACKEQDGAIRLFSATRGASIGFGGENGEAELYRAPIHVDRPIKSRAIRYGYRASKARTINPAMLAACE